MIPFPESRSPAAFQQRKLALSATPRQWPSQQHDGIVTRIPVRPVAPLSCRLLAAQGDPPRDDLLRARAQVRSPRPVSSLPTAMPRKRDQMAQRTPTRVRIPWREASKVSK